MDEDAELQVEARNLFNCEKDLTSYLVESGGSIGPSKLSEQEEDNNS